MLLFPGACDKPAGTVASATAPVPAPSIPTGKPWQVAQRSTFTIPDTGDAVALTIDDVTRGQVMVTLTQRNGPPLAGPVSMREGDAVPVDCAGQRTWLRLKLLDNALVGADHATFVFETTAPPLPEIRKIERLLKLVETSPATFVRNGVEFSGAAASGHLNRKLNSLDTGQLTAEEFITQGASASSQTGEAYEVILPGGQRQSLAEWLRDELRRMEAADSDARQKSPRAE